MSLELYEEWTDVPSFCQRLTEQSWRSLRIRCLASLRASLSLSMPTTTSMDGIVCRRWRLCPPSPKVASNSTFGADIALDAKKEPICSLRTGTWAGPFLILLLCASTDRKRPQRLRKLSATARLRYILSNGMPFQSSQMACNFHTQCAAAGMRGATYLDNSSL